MATTNLEKDVPPSQAQAGATDPSSVAVVLHDDGNAAAVTATAPARPATVQRIPTKGAPPRKTTGLAWYNPMALLAQPSSELHGKENRRRARLYSFLSLAFVTGLVVIFAKIAQRPAFPGQVRMLSMCGLTVAVLLATYAISRTRHANVAAAFGVGYCWLLSLTCILIELQKAKTAAGQPGGAATFGNSADFFFRDPFNWMFGPVWMFLAAVFLSSKQISQICLMDAVVVFFLAGLTETSFLSFRKVFAFHAFSLLALLAASVIQSADELARQRYNQSAGRFETVDITPGVTTTLPVSATPRKTSHAGVSAKFNSARLCSAASWDAVFTCPHSSISHPKQRARARVVSGLLLFFVLITAAWTGVQWQEDVGSEDIEDDDDVASKSYAYVAAGCVAAFTFLYVLSRTIFARMAAFLGMILTLGLPYLMVAIGSLGGGGGSSEARLASLISITVTAVLANKIFACRVPELIILSVAFASQMVFTPYAFQPHIVLVVLFLVTAIMQLVEMLRPDTQDGSEESNNGVMVAAERKKDRSAIITRRWAFVAAVALGLAALICSAYVVKNGLDGDGNRQVTTKAKLVDPAPAVTLKTGTECPGKFPTVEIVDANHLKIKFTELRRQRRASETDATILADIPSMTFLTFATRADVKQGDEDELFELNPDDFTKAKVLTNDEWTTADSLVPFFETSVRSQLTGNLPYATTKLYTSLVRAVTNADQAPADGWKVENVQTLSSSCGGGDGNEDLGTPTAVEWTMTRRWDNLYKELYDAGAVQCGGAKGQKLRGTTTTTTHEEQEKHEDHEIEDGHRRSLTGGLVMLPTRPMLNLPDADEDGVGVDCGMRLSLVTVEYGTDGAIGDSTPPMVDSRTFDYSISMDTNSRLVKVAALTPAVRNAQSASSNRRRLGLDLAAERVTSRILESPEGNDATVEDTENEAADADEDVERDVLYTIEVGTGTCDTSLPLTFTVGAEDGAWEYVMDTPPPSDSHATFQVTIPQESYPGGLKSVSFGFGEGNYVLGSSDACALSLIKITDHRAGMVVQWPEAKEGGEEEEDSASVEATSARRLNSLRSSFSRPITTNGIIGTNGKIPQSSVNLEWLKENGFIGRTGTVETSPTRTSSSNDVENKGFIGQNGRTVSITEKNEIVVEEPRGITWVPKRMSPVDVLSRGGDGSDNDKKERDTDASKKEADASKKEADSASMFRSPLFFYFPVLTFVKPRPVKHLNPITALRVVYGAKNTKPSCPSGYERVSRNLNAGTNGNAVYLCFKRGTGTPINALTIRTRSGTGWPSCPSNYYTVIEHGSCDASGTCRKADLNKGASKSYLFWTSRRRIILCYHRGHSQPVYQLRNMKGYWSSAPRAFSMLGTDLNDDVGGEYLYLAYSKSSSMLAAAVAKAGGDNPDDRLDWISVKEYPNQMRIDVTLRLDCQKDGGHPGACFGDADTTNAEFNEICGLMRDGVEHYWSQPLTLNGITHDVVVKTVETNSGDNKDVDICVRGNSYGDGSSYKRSVNMEWAIWDMTVWYNKGTYASKTSCDANYRETSAHEIGHSFLYAYAGRSHSWGHKGTSTELGGKTDATPNCPPSPQDIDIMKYYKNYCTYYDRIKPTNWDLAKLIMTSDSYNVM